MAAVSKNTGGFNPFRGPGSGLHRCCDTLSKQPLGCQPAPVSAARLGTQVNDDLALTRQYDSMGAPNREEAPHGRYSRLFCRHGCSQGAGGSAVEPFFSAFGRPRTLADCVSVV